MIVELTVENIAIIERAQLVLGPGYTVLTGETGAGKSLLIDAIELALGERADFELVRSGMRAATVSVVFDLSQRPEIVERCEELGIPLEESTLYLQRELIAEGRSQCRAGGKLLPVAVVKQLGSILVDLHGQHDHQALLNSEGHDEHLDAWIGHPADTLKVQVAEKFARAAEARRRLEGLRAGLRDREHRLDLLKFQANEIESVAPKAGELEESETMLSRLKHTEKLAEASFSALEATSDGESNAADLLGVAVANLQAAVKFDPTLEPAIEALNGALVSMQEAAHELRGYAESLDADPERLEEVAGRIDALKRLRRKYGVDEAEVLAFLEKVREELDLLEDGAESEEELATAYSGALAALVAKSGELTKLRQERGVEFDRLVAMELSDLGMERAQFRTHFSPREPDADGADSVEFYFSANAGEPQKPLSKIASGGEISRVMLAIKSSLAGKAGVPTLIFDEVDAGLGGRAAATVAKKIEELASHYQVLVISHLPQIACRATTHYRIEKGESDRRVVASVRRLNDEERVREIARMLAGEEVTNSAIANAREMLSGKVVASALFD